MDAPQPVGASRPKITKKPEGVLPKLARVAVAMTCCAALLALFGYQRARGQLGEQLLGVGAQMMMVSDAERQDAPRELRINGERIFVSSGIAPIAPSALLDRFAARCEQVDAAMMAHVSEAVATRPEHEGARRLESFRPLLREERDGVGFVACLDLGRERADLETLVARYRRFRETRDLHDIGDLRYVYVEPASDGATHFVAVWSEGSLRYDALFPDRGDAPGADPRDVPRPPGARRVISAWERGVDQRATVYRGAELEEGQLEGFYRRELPAHGWRLLDATDDPRLAPSDVRPALVAMRADRMIWIALSTDEEGRGTAAVVSTGDDEAP